MTTLFDMQMQGFSQDALISECGLYRYWLVRRWDASLPGATFVMLNPSTADATEDDPTIRKCVGFAKRWGCGGVRVVNLFAYRATDPKDLLAARARGVDIVGPGNDFETRPWMPNFGPIVCAWGTHAAKAPERVRVVRELLRPYSLSALRLSKDGHPWHPLYVPYEVALVPFWPVDAR